MSKTKSRDIFDKMVIMFLVLQPFIDAITCIEIKSNISFLSVSSIVRGIFFVIVITYLIREKINLKCTMSFIIYFLLSILYNKLLTDNRLSVEIANIFQIFYLPFLIMFFNNYSNKYVNDKFILKLYFIYLNLIIIPYLLGIGYSVSEFYEEKIGYLGLFYGGNEISAILIGLLPTSINALIKNKNKIINIVFIVELLACTILVGTKTLMLGVIIVILYFSIKYLKNNFNSFSKLKKRLTIIVPVIFFIVFIVVLPYTPMYKNIVTAAKFFNVDFSNLFSMYGLNKIVFSGRLGFLEKINDTFINSSILSIFMGIGKTTLINTKLIEIDIFDIFYSIGIIGFVIWILYMIKGMKNSKLNGIYKFTFILLIIISIFAGHILTSTNVSIYLALMIILNKNEKEEANE